MRKRLELLIILLALSLPLAAATSYSLVSGIGHMSNFAYGNITNFPSSAVLAQGVGDLGWFDDVDTAMQMDMSFGLAQRRLVQDPLTGNYLSAKDLSQGSQYYYSVFYSEVSYIFRNELFDNRKTDAKTLRLDAALNVRFEQAFDSLDNIRSGRSFLDTYLADINPNTDTTYWNASQNFIAAPDIAGEAYMLANSLSLTAVWNDMYSEDNGIYRQGLVAGGRLTLAPFFLVNHVPSLFDTRVDYYSLLADVTYSHVLYSKEDWKRWNRLSILLENHSYAQLLLGTAVPKFADNINFPGIGYTNLPLVAQNQLRLYIYGPNFLSDNTIPYGYIFLDAGLASGVPNNSIDLEWENFVYAEVGVNVHFVLLGAMHLSAEASYVFSNMDTYGNFFDWSIGAYFSI